jgi:hypothetical protein
MATEPLSFMAAGPRTWDMHLRALGKLSNGVALEAVPGTLYPDSCMVCAYAQMDKREIDPGWDRLHYVCHPEFINGPVRANWKCAHFARSDWAGVYVGEPGIHNTKGD